MREVGIQHRCSEKLKLLEQLAGKEKSDLYNKFLNKYERTGEHLRSEIAKHASMDRGKM